MPPPPSELCSHPQALSSKLISGQTRLCVKSWDTWESEVELDILGRAVSP